MNHGGTYTFIAGTIGVYNGTYDDVEYEFFDGTGHLVGVQITTQTGDALRFSIRTYDSSVVRTLIVPAGSTGGYLDLSGENFYLAKSQGQLQMTWDEEFGGL